MVFVVLVCMLWSLLICFLVVFGILKSVLVCEGFECVVMLNYLVFVEYFLLSMVYDDECIGFVQYEEIVNEFIGVGVGDWVFVVLFYWEVDEV